VWQTIIVIYPLCQRKSGDHLVNHEYWAGEKIIDNNSDRKSKMSLQILLLSDVLQGMGGAERNLTIVASQLRDRGYVITIVALKGGEVAQNLKLDNFDVHDLNISKIYDANGILGIIKLLKIIRKKNISIVITYHESSDFIGVFLSLFANVAVISNRRDMGFNLRKRHVKVYRFVNHRFAAIVAVSNSVKSAIIRSQKVNPEKIAVIYNGVDTSCFDDSIKYFDNYPWIENNELIAICCLANIRPIKGHRYLLEAAVDLKKKDKVFHLYLVGHFDADDLYYQKLNEFISFNKLDDYVSFIGPIKHSDVWAFLNKMDISVLPSLSEGMSNTLLESMASSLPIVSTDVGGNSEVVVHGKTGYLVPPRNSKLLFAAIAKLHGNKSLRKQMGQEGMYRFNELFTVSMMIDKYEDVIRTVANR